MSYRKDRDLEFLKEMPSKDLDDLVRCLTHDEDGDTRMTETLTVSEEYKAHYPDHHKYWDRISEELQLFGGNSLANLLRFGKGVPYREILTDVCDKLKVNYNSQSKIEVIENCLLMKILEDTIDNMTEQERKEFAKQAGLKGIHSFTPAAMTLAFQAIFRAGGFKAYQVTLIIVNSVIKTITGRGLSLALNASLVKVCSKLLAGPIGYVLSSIWILIDIAGPAYRVTMPATFIIAALRQKHLQGI
ncbi:DUF3944 domain-containing protein [Dethiosulfovibrio salsuginis]|uniref:Uncharacterized protein YaaW, UPF0174 family n=1 Tax=Dethiosulfovibrio salsuginis TaxID=561720 RepID=A0A1X7K811_9BACT|nr:DUF3944 domain-containing protein [Dethiosulfovibrio salsuginis]SMG36976.1 Uncharacterized protein YaaW, UPF0174 family [Dethiosulfovibrio salsuginis]